MYSNFIEVVNLRKTFGKTAALEGLNFSVEKGEIFGIAGPNGAGKSTFISILTTVLKPTAGDIFINGISIKNEYQKIREIIGYVPQETALYTQLTGMDNLKFWSSVYGLKGAAQKKRIKEAVEITQISDKIGEKVGNYSGGYKQRLNIAVALLHHPQVLVMDEPTAGVDLRSKRFILDTIRSYKSKGSTVLLATHHIDELVNVCDRAVVLDKGRMKSIGTIKEIMEQFGEDNMEDIMIHLDS
ncbi:MAG: ABC transporter ATP-binding protein [Eubacteriales bacterium]|nr:ABC transporter ATP-binding protein [Eubacteriales bacterium]